MRFKGLDLNLLVAFEALLESHSVTRAAEGMHLSQAAMSSALGRLREYFGDELLIAQGKRMYPTAYAESLLPKVRECLKHAEGLIGTTPVFDAATSARTFRICASDYLAAVLLCPLVTRLATVAPHVRLDIVPPSELVVKQIEDGDIDLLIAPHEYMSHDLPADLLYEETHVIAGWQDNPLVAAPISESALFAAGHVAVSFGATRTTSFSDRHLETMGKSRHIEITAPSFTTVPWLLIGTNRLAFMHKRLAAVMSRGFPIRYVDLPFEFPLMREMAQFHPTRITDEGLTWFRAQLKLVANDVDRAPT